MRAEGSCEGGGIGVHIVHALVGVAQIAELGVFKGGLGGHGPLPGAQRPGRFLPLALRLHDAGGNAPPQPRIRPRDFRHGAHIVVHQLHIGGAAFIFQPVQRLHPHQHLGHIQIQREGRGQGRGQIRRQQQKYAVDIPFFQFLHHAVGFLHRGYVIGYEHLRRIVKQRQQRRRLGVKLRLQAGKLGKIDFVPQGNQGDRALMLFHIFIHLQRYCSMGARPPASAFPMKNSTFRPSFFLTRPQFFCIMQKKNTCREAAPCFRRCPWILIW